MFVVLLKKEPSFNFFGIIDTGQTEGGGEDR
jgi:hypothetical protein